MTRTTPIPEVVTVTGLSHDGRGVARGDGKTLFVEGALPGEEVTFTITRSRSRFIEASVREVLKAAPERVTPPCPHYNHCGGCNLQLGRLGAMRVCYISCDAATLARDARELHRQSKLRLQSAGVLDMVPPHPEYSRTLLRSVNSERFFRTGAVLLCRRSRQPVRLPIFAVLRHDRFVREARQALRTGRHYLHIAAAGSAAPTVPHLETALSGKLRINQALEDVHRLRSNCSRSGGGSGMRRLVLTERGFALKLWLQTVAVKRTGALRPATGR